MKIEITTIFDKAGSKQLGNPDRTEINTSQPAALRQRQPVRETLHRYCSIALISAVAVGGIMMVCGLRPLGKGLILGAIFSVINFILMASALPMRVGLDRKKAFLFSLGSIHLRYALMAVPLVISLNQDTFAVSTVAVGLFMVQIALLGDQLWAWLRNPERVKC